MRHYRLQHYLSAVVILLVVFALWSTRLTAPLTGRHDNVVTQSILTSENHERHGIAALGLLYVFDADDTYDVPQTYYVSGPALSSIIITLLRPILVSTIFASRILAAFVTLLGAATFYQFVHIMWQRHIALIAFAIYLLVPVMLFYGISMSPDILAAAGLSFIVLFYARYARWQRSIDLFALALGVLFASLVSLYLFFVIPLLCLHALFFVNQRWRLIITMCITMIIGVSLWLVPGMMIYPQLLEDLFGRASQRTFINTAPPWDSALDYFWTIAWARFRIRYTEVVLLLAAIGGLLLVPQVISPRFRSRAVLILMILAAGIAPIIIFSEAYYTHDFMTLTLLAGIALLAAIGLNWLWDYFQSREGIQRIAAGIVLLAMTGGFMASGLRWTIDLYTTIDTFPVEMGVEIAERVPSGNIIYSDLDWNPALWYYAGRDVRPLKDIPDDTPVYTLLCNDATTPDNNPEIIVINDLICAFNTP